MKRIHASRGFTLVEIAIGIVLVGLVLLAFAGMTNVVQKSSNQTRQYADAQQNARAALDLLTTVLRSSGSGIAAYDGQGVVVHAGPNQVAVNADIDGGKVINGEQPLDAIDIAGSFSTVPPSGTAIYAPGKSFKSGAETIVFTLDSDQSGVVDDGDQGDDDVENGRNTHLYVLKYDRYGKTAAGDEQRQADVALVRGPVAYDNGTNPPPLFEYYYDDDNDLTTPDVLWGDINGDLQLDSGEIGSLTDMPANLLFGIRMIKINVVAEGTSVATRDNQGFAHVVMSSRVYIRNADSHDSAQIYGVVFYDANADGKQNSGESGIPNVVVTVSQTGRKTQTNQFGQYNLPVNGGTYTVVETVPATYVATTSSSVNVTINNGETQLVNFGCNSSAKSGYIVGTVWDDVNMNAINDGEQGIPDVVVTLNNGMAGKTRSNGYYRITAPLGSYVVTETDLTGYSSTTPNSQSATLVNDQDSVTVNFGDAVGNTQGTLSGYVYEDSDRNGLRAGGESGIAGVTITTSQGQTTTTDAAGYYEFDLDPGKYDVYELDLDGYTSTTPNIVENISILTGGTETQDFGDILMKDLTFVEVAVGNTQKPLSLTLGDMKEDFRGDTDIILGTPKAATNLFLYLNAYVDPSTPLTSLFPSTPNQVYKSGTSDVNAVQWMDRTGDGYLDVLAGQEASGNNVVVWYNDSATHDFGSKPGSIESSGLSSATMCYEKADVDDDGSVDLFVGHKSKLATYAGGFEIQTQIAPGSFTSQQVTTTNGKGTVMGVVVAAAFGDLDKDGDPDLVTASNNGNTWGHIDLWSNDGKGSFIWYKRLLAKAGVNDVAVADLQNDGSGLPDILVGVTEAQNVGSLQIWLNKLGVFGVADKTGYTYNGDEDKKVPDFRFNSNGEALAVSAQRLDADIYPEIVIGTRSSSFFTGSLLIVQEPLTKNQRVTDVKVNVAGEVVSIEIGDMNKDSFQDVVITTRTSSSTGKLAIYFLNNIYVP